MPDLSTDPKLATDRCRSAFSTVYGGDPVLTWSAPGRVNLIGEHTDYNDGFVLPFALPRRTSVAAGRSDTPQWSVWSESMNETVTFTVDDLVPTAVTGWAGYVAGVIWALAEAGVRVPRARLAIASDIPLGAGLSSSAALECAVLAAMLDLAGATDVVPRSQWPAIARHAENAYVGVPCGIMDQTATILCRADHALFLDCRTQQSEHIPLLLAASGLGVLIVDTKARRQLVSGEYAARRATCKAAAHTLGVPALRDVVDLSGALATLPDDITRRRVRHVVSENHRVREVVALLRAGRPHEIGPLLSASHASLRDDYEVTSAELDLAADTAVAAGALGSRMTGAGFGGCAIALTPLTETEHISRAIAEAFAARGFALPTTFVAEPSMGVHKH